MTRVAVQPGAVLRLAAEGRLVAELPAGTNLPNLLSALFTLPLDELLVVHPGGAPREALPATVAATARVVRAVPAAVAAVAQHARSTGLPTRGAVVVDVGCRGADVARVADGRVVAVRHVPVGGARLDAVTARVLAGAGTCAPTDARRVREELSLLPAVQAGTPPVVVEARELRAALAEPLTAVVVAVCSVLRAAGPGGSPPVLLVGGVARTPLLAELLDAAGVADVRVLRRPDLAAVTGALLLPSEPVQRSRTGSAVPAGGSGSPPPAPADVWLPPVVPARFRRLRMLLGTAAAAAVAGLLATVAVRPPAPVEPPPSAEELVQYGYAARLPAGWAHTGGLPERRRTLLTPVGAPDGSDLISVERTPLGYDADAEPRRARAELRAEFTAAVAAGAPLDGFDDEAHYAGRPVVTYREAGGPTAGAVDWYVVLDGDAQLSVGCRHTPAGTAAVGSACATVVGSVRRTP